MKKISKSRTGWWMVGLLAKHSDEGRAPFWNNYRLVRAEDWRTAFRRATEMGNDDVRVGNEAFSDKQEFVGIADLLPIYDEFEDGAELLWQELWPDPDNSNGTPLDVYSEADLESEYEEAEQVGDGDAEEAV